MRRNFERFFQITVGREVKQFIAHDLIYILVLAVSGIIILFSWQAAESVFGNILSSIYQAVLLFTLFCYAYIRLIRNKRYHEKEIRAIRLGVTWLVIVFGSAVIIMAGLMFVDDLGDALRISLPFDLIRAIWIIGTALAAVFSLFQLFSDEHYHNNETAKSFAVLFTDGLAWTGAVGGIGIIAVFDIVYVGLLLLESVGIIPA
jgi:hypothetical protein